MPTAKGIPFTEQTPNTSSVTEINLNISSGLLTTKDESASASSSVIPGDRGILGAGDSFGAKVTYVTISTPGNATYFTDVSNSRAGKCAVANGGNNKCLLLGGNSTGTEIDFVHISQLVLASGYGGLTVARWGSGSASNGTGSRGLIAGDYTNAVETLDMVSIANGIDATFFGNLTNNGGGRHPGMTSNGTNNRAIRAGGANTSDVVVNHKDRLNFLTFEDSADNGNLSEAKRGVACTSNDTNETAAFLGGSTGTATQVAETSNITTDADSVNYGDMAGSNIFGANGATSNGVNGTAVVCGTVAATNTIVQFAITTGGTATDFGDLPDTGYNMATASNSQQ